MKTPHEYAWVIAHAVKRKKPPPMYIVDIIEDHVRKIITDTVNKLNERATENR